MVPDFKHIIVLYKTENLEFRGLYQMLHNYVQANGSVVAMPRKNLSSDNFCSFLSKPFWPIRLDGEIIIGKTASPPPLKEETAVSYITANTKQDCEYYTT